MKGYKAFNYDWTCRDFQYEVGKEYEMDGPIEICERGFHFCENPRDCFMYYPFSEMTRIAEIEASDYNIKRNFDGTKYCTNKIKIVREVLFNEILKAFQITKEAWDAYVKICPFVIVGLQYEGYSVTIQQSDMRPVVYFHSNKARGELYLDRSKVILRFFYEANKVDIRIMNNHIFAPSHFSEEYDNFPADYKHFIFNLTNFLKNKFDLS